MDEGRASRVSQDTRQVMEEEFRRGKRSDRPFTIEVLLAKPMSSVASFCLLSDTYDMYAGKGQQQNE